MKVGFDTQHRREQDTSLFKLDKDETARICCIDKNLEMAPTHWINLGENARGGGRYKCLGSYDKIYGVGDTAGTGADPDVCPFCKYGTRDGKVGQVGRQFATHIIKYPTDSHGKVRQPIEAAEIITWRFGDDKYSRLVDIKEGWAPDGDLRLLDLSIKCMIKLYQKFQIDPFPVDKSVLKLGGAAFMKYIAVALKEAQQKDLSKVLGNQITAEGAEQLCKTALGLGTPAESVAAASAVATPEELTSLFETPPTAAPAQPPPQPLGTPEKPVVGAAGGLKMTDFQKMLDG